MPERFSFTRPATERIANVVRAVENARPGGRPLESQRQFVDSRPKTFRIATFTGTWAISSSKVVTMSNQPTSTVAVQNLFFSVTDTAVATRTCAVAKEGSSWYLVTINDEASQKKTAQAAVITGVSLTTAGLEFQTTTVKILETVSTGVIVVSTTACA